MRSTSRLMRSCASNKPLQRTKSQKQKWQALKLANHPDQKSGSEPAALDRAYTSDHMKVIHEERHAANAKPELWSTPRAEDHAQTRRLTQPLRCINQNLTINWQGSSVSSDRLSSETRIMTEKNPSSGVMAKQAAVGGLNVSAAADNRRWANRKASLLPGSIISDTPSSARRALAPRPKSSCRLRMSSSGTG